MSGAAETPGPRLRYALAAAGVMAIDQASKIWAAGCLAEGAPVVVLPGLFRLVLVRNRGALFGMFQDLHPHLRALLFLALPAVVIAVLGWLSWRTPAGEQRAQWAFTLLLGGAFGNLADRLRLGYVVDFLDFYVVGPGGDAHHWPAFNVADACICVGIALLALDSWRRRRARHGEEERAPDSF